MSRVVLDASALLAVLGREPGTEVGADRLKNSLISTVNLAEVFSKTQEKGIENQMIEWAVSGLQIETVPFDEELARITGGLREATRDQGLSLGDRACLALGKREGLPVLTKDRVWADVDVGVQVELLRAIGEPLLN